MVNNWLNSIQDTIFPPTCIFCGNQGFNSQDICPACFDELPKNTTCCYRCATPFQTSFDLPQLCGKCLKTPPAFDKTTAPFHYQHTIRYLITQLKFNHQYKNARLLGYLLAQHLQTTDKMPELIIPIPLHQQRFQQRSFNQSLEIAQTVSKHLHIPINHNSCLRHKNTSQQMTLTAKQRQKNIKNAFKIIKPINAQYIAILDDVMTTGSTVNEFAKTLKKSGIKQVDIWVCSRA